MDVGEEDEAEVEGIQFVVAGGDATIALQPAGRERPVGLTRRRAVWENRCIGSVRALGDEGR